MKGRLQFVLGQCLRPNKGVGPEGQTQFPTTVRCRVVVMCRAASSRVVVECRVDARTRVSTPKWLPGLFLSRDG